MSDSKIHILPDFIANQIAAGEVVQRPESVVKELVENSIDSGADSIAVIVRDAGKKLIHIIDNGMGMSEEDLKLSIKRHATSKIISQADLENILTYGFRGEALASISSISQLEIRTRQKENELGWQLLSEPNQIVKTNPISTDIGTQVFVRNLFYNVPARRKFLRSNLTEFRYISDTMMRLSIGKPNLRFTFYDDDNLIFDTKSKNLDDRIIEILGNIEIHQLIPINDENAFISISGYIGSPELARQSRSNQFLYLNGRSIFSKSINHAVFSAFESILDKNTYPLFIINLKIDPSKVDVNIHPQKHEVKFEDDNYIYKLVNRCVLNSLKERSIVPNLSLASNTAKSPFERITTDQEELIVNIGTGEVLETNIHQHNRKFDLIGKYDSPTKIDFNSGNSYSKDLKRVDDNIDFGNINQRITREEISAFDELMKSSKELLPIESSQSYIKWNGYILEINRDHIKLINIRRASQRIIFDKLMANIESHKPQAQSILFPITKEFSKNSIELIQKNLVELTDLGFDMTIENNLITFNGIPNIIQGGADSEFINILEKHLDYSLENLESDFINHLIIKIAHWSGLRYLEAQSIAELSNFVKQLNSSSNPNDTPLGKPIIMKIEISQIDKSFNL